MVSEIIRVQSHRECVTGFCLSPKSPLGLPVGRADRQCGGEQSSKSGSRHCTINTYRGFRLLIQVSHGHSRQSIWLFTNGTVMYVSKAVFVS